MTTQKSKEKSLRERIFDVIQIAGGTDTMSRLFDYTIITLILISIAITTAQTFALPAQAVRILNLLDAVCMIAFTIEYLLRLWTADLLYPASKVPHLRFLVSPSALIDLLSFLPFYLTGLIPEGMVVFRLIRVARILRLFRINSYLDPVAAILSVLKRKASLIFASLFLVFVLMFASSLLMYYAEHEAQPELFENAFSGLWWAVSTLSTTGYGDIYPITFLGKILAIIITLLGMCIVAIPTGIITAGFMEAARNTDPKSYDSEDASWSQRLLDISTASTTVLAPALINPDTSSVEQLPLSTFVGRCIVETVYGELSPDQAGAIISKASGEASRRILLRGDVVLSEKAARFLAEFGILLLGYSAANPWDDKIRNILLSNRVILLSDLDLSDIEDGEYILNASPILAPNAASAPCRAYLLHSTSSS